VQAGADFEAERVHDLDDRLRAVNRSGGPVEAGDEAIAGGVDLAAAEADQLAPNEFMVPFEQLAPSPVAELGRSSGRTDDVGEEHCRQHTFGLGFIPAAGLPHVAQERLDLVQRSIQLRRGHRLPPAGDLDEPGAGDSICQVACPADRRDRVVAAVDDQRRHPDRGQHVPNVDLAVHLM
jgi:hypothetical protein